jgi:hypothetical protein
MEKQSIVKSEQEISGENIDNLNFMNIDIVHLSEEYMKAMHHIKGVGDLMIRCFSTKSIAPEEIRTLVGALPNNIRMKRSLRLDKNYVGETVVLIDKRLQVIAIISADIDIVARLPIPLINEFPKKLGGLYGCWSGNARPELPVIVSIAIGTQVIRIAEVPVFDCSHVEMYQLEGLTEGLQKQNPEDLHDILNNHGLLVKVEYHPCDISEKYQDAALVVTGSPVTIAVLREKFHLEPIGCTYEPV